MKILRILLFPFALLYGLVTRLRNILYDNGILKSRRFELPVIVVGNLSTGGTGKTPQVEYLIRLLSNSHKVAVLSRGYKRKSKGFLLGDSDTSVTMIGDESYQYLTKFDDLQVAVSENRCVGIERLLETDNPPEVIVLDDAFQHRRVKSDCNVLLTCYDSLYLNDVMLPTGNLREPKSGSKRAQCIVVTKCPPDLSEKQQQQVRNSLKPDTEQQVFFSTISYADHVKGKDREIAVADLTEFEVLLVTGIANPDPLYDYLAVRNIRATHLKFPDHHHFSSKDMDEIKSTYDAFGSNKRIILTTEKDYVRIFGRLSSVYYLPIKTAFLGRGEAFDKIITDYVGHDPRNN